MSTKSTERKEYKYLTEDGKFPADLDWNMEIKINEQEQTKQVRYYNLDWELALFCGGPNILEVLTEDQTYYQMLDGGTDVGYRFDFEIDQENTVTAHGTLCAARITHLECEVFGDLVLVEADLELRPRDPRTEGALREYVEYVQARN